MSGCIFCQVVAGTVPRWIVDEDEWTIAFLDGAPATDGHTLVVPKRHAADIWEISPEEMARVAIAVHRVAELLRQRLEPDGLTLFQTNRAAGWQDVFLPDEPGGRLAGRLPSARPCGAAPWGRPAAAPVARGPH